MNRHKVNYRLLFLSICLTLAGTLTSAAGTLRVYLPKEKILSTDVITLGQVGLILGDTSLTPRVEKIKLGQFAIPGQELKIDRKTILSRIAGEGIAASVQFNGAETICLRREGNCIAVEQFIEVAESCLRKSLADKNVASLKVFRSPDHVPLIGDNKDITFTAQLAGRQVGQTRRVTVSAIQKNKTLSQQDVIFEIQYRCQRWVAADDLPAKTPLTPENTKVETYLSNLPQKNQPKTYGMLTRRAISKGAKITPALVEPKEPVILVKRRHKVLLRLETGGLLISAQGEAMSDGSVGDLIEVRRGKGREQRSIIGKVMPDGTVEPVM